MYEKNKMQEVEKGKRERGKHRYKRHGWMETMEGKVVAGPAPRPLDQYETRVENGKLLLGRREIPGVRKR